MTKNPWLAAILNIIFPGTGYLYLGKRKLLAVLILLADLSFFIWTLLNWEKSQLLFNDFYFGITFLFLGLAFPIDAYKEAKKINISVSIDKNPTNIQEQKEVKNDNNKLFRRIFIGIFIAALVYVIITGFNVLGLYLGWHRYTSPDVLLSETIKPIEYGIISNFSLILSALSLFLIPLLSKKLKNRRPSMILISILIGLFILTIAFATIDGIYHSNSKSKPESSSHHELSDKALIDGINLERLKNKSKKLKENIWVCEIAKIRLKDLLKIGAKTFDNSSALNRAIDKVSIDLENNPKFIKAIEPEYFTEIYTYQATVEEAIQSWAKYPENDFLTGGKYEYGCTAVGDGYGVFIGGYGDIDKAREENIYNSPKMYEPKPSTEIL